MTEARAGRGDGEKFPCNPSCNGNFTAKGRGKFPSKGVRRKFPLKEISVQGNFLSTPSPCVWNFHCKGWGSFSPRGLEGNFLALEFPCTEISVQAMNAANGSYSTESLVFELRRFELHSCPTTFTPGMVVASLLVNVTILRSLIVTENITYEEFFFEVDLLNPPDGFMFLWCCEQRGALQRVVFLGEMELTARQPRFITANHVQLNPGLEPSNLIRIFAQMITAALSNVTQHSTCQERKMTFA